MIAVHLYGELADTFGSRWDLDVGSASEVVQAIEANRPGFYAALVDLAERGFDLDLVNEGEHLEADHLGLWLRGDLHIVPVVQGSGGAGSRVLIGALLIAAAVFTGPVGWAFAGYGMVGGLTATQAFFVASMGASLALGGITEMLTPTPKFEQTSTEQKQSYTLTGPTNELEMGEPVPLIYGEVLVGSKPLSGGVTTSDFSGSAPTDVVIVGPSTLSTSRITTLGEPDVGDGVNRFRLSVDALGLEAPITYAWTTTFHSGTWAIESQGAEIVLTCTELNDATHTASVSVTATDALNNINSSAVLGLTSKHAVTHVYRMGYDWAVGGAG